MNSANLPPILILLMTILVFACEPDVGDAVFITRQAAEFEPQEAVWLIWPQEDHLEGFSNDQVVLDVITSILPYTYVKVVVSDPEIRLKAERVLPAASLESGKIELLEIPAVQFWTRDMGPTFVENNKGEQVVADFNFNAWGYSDTLDADTRIEEQFDERAGRLLGLPVISSNMISEGGNREVNGKGTLMLVERVEAGRNPHLSKADMEKEFERMLGVRRVVWLKEGLYEDDHTFLGPLDLGEGRKAYTVVTTDGHVDEFARFVNDSTILLASVVPEDRDDAIGRENHRRLESNYEILKAARDQDGQPFRIVRMPLPKNIIGTMKPGDPVYDYISTLDYTDGSVFPEGDTIRVVAAASYLNFLVTNGCVIAPKYWRPGWDEEILARDQEAARILQEVFPERKILMIDALAINFGGGGIHCITMQQPLLAEKE
jgi:agmatine deiminase